MIKIPPHIRVRGEPAPSPLSAIRQPSFQPHFHGRRMLVVEPNYASALSLTANLRSWGAWVDTIDSASAAISLILDQDRALLSGTSRYDPQPIHSSYDCIFVSHAVEASTTPLSLSLLLSPRSLNFHSRFMFLVLSLCPPTHTGPDAVRKGAPEPLGGTGRDLETSGALLYLRGWFRFLVR